MAPNELVFSAAGKHVVDFTSDFPLQLFYYDFSRLHAATPNYHDYFEITYVLEGQGLFNVGGKEHPAVEGNVFVINSGVFHNLDCPDAHHLKVLCLFFLPELIYRPGAGELDLDYLLLFLNRGQAFNPKVTVDRDMSQLILRLIDETAQELGSKGNFYRISVKNHLCQILLMLNRAAEVSGDASGDLHVRLRDINRLQPVFDCIHERYPEKLALRELSAAANMSVTHLCRYFKKVTGKTITEYITRYRIDRAKQLLIEDEHSITWVAYEVGFESHSYFDRIFNQVTKLTPQEFRKRFAAKARVAK